jgi:hypothetical protein
VSDPPVATLPRGSLAVYRRVKVAPAWLGLGLFASYLAAFSAFVFALGLYAALGMGSWFGAALVERALGLLLD